MGSQVNQPKNTPSAYFHRGDHEPPDAAYEPLPHPYEPTPQESPRQYSQPTYGPLNAVAQPGTNYNYNNVYGDSPDRRSGNQNTGYSAPSPHPAFGRLRAQRRQSQTNDRNEDRKRTWKRGADQESNTHLSAHSNGRIRPALSPTSAASSSIKADVLGAYGASNPASSSGDTACDNQCPRNSDQAVQVPIAAPRRPPNRVVDGLWPATHRLPTDRGEHQQDHHREQQEDAVQGQRRSNITLGADNFTELAAGGMAGIAYTIAEKSPRESGLQAIGAVERPDGNSHSGMLSLNGTQGQPGKSTPGTATPPKPQHRWGSDVYADGPYQSSARHDMNLGMVTPNDIEDDGDDGLDYGRRSQRVSILSLSSHRAPPGSGSGSTRTTGGEGATLATSTAAIGATAGAVAGTFVNSLPGSRGGLPGGRYAPVSTDSVTPSYDRLPDTGAGKEAGLAPGMAFPSGRSPTWKRWRMAIILLIGLAIIAAIVCGVLFGVVFKNHHDADNNDSGSSSSATTDTAANGDLSLDSPEIQALLNNKQLHKVFPGIDYTPINTQYPECVGTPPSPNNVTRDLAVLSQLTNNVRLYGTDCNQTEMLIHSIDQLEMKDTIKIWMGVWQDNNVTTNKRQLAQVWDILDHYGDSYFAGIIVANEILFREQMDVSELGSLLSDVRTNLSSRGMSLPVATSDLGRNWTKELADKSDFVMANVHPFFAGTNAKDAASWTWDYWEDSVGPVFKSNKSRNIISETGWPSRGGTDCGSGSTETSCPDAAVAGISELNQFMDSWVCDALANGTEYFWFEAFDEPWKVTYNTGNQNWEDHWGLMDVNRNLKDGVVIPSCDGKTVD